MQPICLAIDIDACFIGMQQRRYHELNELLRERRSISPEMALRLGRLFGNSPEFWLNAQRTVDLWNAAAAIKKRCGSHQTTKCRITIKVRSWHASRSRSYLNCYVSMVPGGCPRIADIFIWCCQKRKSSLLFVSGIIMILVYPLIQQTARRRDDFGSSHAERSACLIQQLVCCCAVQING